MGQGDIATNTCKKSMCANVPTHKPILISGTPVRISMATDCVILIVNVVEMFQALA